MYSLEACQFDDVKPLKRKAYNEHVDLFNSHYAAWFRAVDEFGVLVGCACLDLLKKGGSRVSGLYVIPSWRGRGVGSALVSACLSIAPVGPISCFALDASHNIFIRAGFRAPNKPRRVSVDGNEVIIHYLKKYNDAPSHI